MILVDKYIYAIGQKLPLKSRNEIKTELKSLLLDEIEAKYGENPSEDNIKRAITEFGTPGSVAKKYSNSSSVIGSGFTDLYYLIMKIIVGALTIAFTTIFIVTLFTENPAGLDILKALVQVPLRVFQASLGGIGTLTIIFIIISRLCSDKEIDIESEWTIKELESINLTQEQESKIESIIALILIPVFIAFVILYPEFIQFLENSFEKSGLTLGNKVNMDVFKSFIPLFVLQGLLQIVYQIMLLKKEIKTKALYIFDASLSVFDLLVTITILKLGTMFIYAGGVNNGIFSYSTIGFKIFIVIGLFTGIGELLSKSIKYVKKEIEEKKSFM